MTYKHENRKVAYKHTRIHGMGIQAALTSVVPDNHRRTANWEQLVSIAIALGGGVDKSEFDQMRRNIAALRN